jgi:hypothetical protein
MGMVRGGRVVGALQAWSTDSFAFKTCGLSRSKYMLVCFYFIGVQVFLVYIQIQYVAYFLETKCAL